MTRTQVCSLAIIHDYKIATYVRTIFNFTLLIELAIKWVNETFTFQTLPALTKCIHKAFSVGSETAAARPVTSATLTTSSSNGAASEKPQFQLSPMSNGSSKPPLSDQMFRSFMNNVGELVRARELRLAIYHGGVESQLRKVVWKHILGVYPSNLNGRERMDYMRQKSLEYESLKSTWIDLAAQGQVPDKVKFVTNMIRKDVLRTDRHHKFFASNANCSPFT